MNRDTQADVSRAPPLGVATVGYGLMVVLTVVAFFLIRNHGEALVAPMAVGAESAVSLAQGPNILLHVLVALTAVIVTGQILAKVFAYLNQPPVIGEVLAGILLGPSLLGQIYPLLSCHLRSLPSWV
ncbi:MAG: hypothetical protein ABR543_08205 [Gemmatimonadaceae bacterium]